MRLLKFIGAFVLTAVVIFGIVIGLNWNSFTTFFENRSAMMEGTEWVPKTSSLKGLSEFMDENPQHTSLASIVINRPDSAIFYRENTPRVMGATANFFILTAFAMQFESGLFNPQDRVEWAEISKYQLPQVEESLHNEAYNAARDRGWIEDESITLQNALSLLAQFGDPALADYLWWQLDSDIWTNLQENLNLSSTDMPLPYSGLYQAISPGLTDMDNPEIIDRWQNEDSQQWREHVTELSRSYINDPDFRSEVRDDMQNNRLGNTFMEERDAMILFPKTTAESMAVVLQKLAGDSLVSEYVSRTVRDFMDWPMEYQPQIDRDFTQYGAIYDNRMGLMNGIDFGTSTYTGDTTIQALFLDQLPIAFWFHASGSQMHQDFMQRLIFDPAMIDQMYRVVDE